MFKDFEEQTAIFKNSMKVPFFSIQDLCISSSRMGERHNNCQNTLLEHCNIKFHGALKYCV